MRTQKTQFSILILLSILLDCCISDNDKVQPVANCKITSIWDSSGPGPGSQLYLTWNNNGKLIQRSPKQGTPAPTDQDLYSYEGDSAWIGGRNSPFSTRILMDANGRFLNTYTYSVDSNTGLNGFILRHFISQSATYHPSGHLKSTEVLWVLKYDTIDKIYDIVHFKFTFNYVENLLVSTSYTQYEGPFSGFEDSLVYNTAYFYSRPIKYPPVNPLAGNFWIMANHCFFQSYPIPEYAIQKKANLSPSYPGDTTFFQTNYDANGCPTQIIRRYGRAPFNSGQNIQRYTYECLK